MFSNFSSHINLIIYAFNIFKLNVFGWPTSLNLDIFKLNVYIVIQSGQTQIECFWFRYLFNLNWFNFNLVDRCRKSVNACPCSERDDESSEDGCVESSPDEDSDAVEEKGSGGKNEAAINATTTKKYLPRESIICCNYDPLVLIFDGSDWTAIKGPRGQHFAIGVESFDK